MYPSTITICRDKQQSLFLPQNLQLQTYSHSYRRTRICAPLSIPSFLLYLLLESCIDRCYSLHLRPRSFILFINAMQVSRMLPSSRAYSRAYRKLTLSSPDNHGQHKGQSTLAMVGHGRSDVDQRSVTLKVYFLAPAGRLHTRRAP